MGKINNWSVVQLASPAQMFVPPRQAHEKLSKMGFLMDTIATTERKIKITQRERTRSEMLVKHEFSAERMLAKKCKRTGNDEAAFTQTQSSQLKFLGRLLVRSFFFFFRASRLITFDWRWALHDGGNLKCSQTHVNGYLNEGPIGGWFIDGSDLIYGEGIYLTFPFHPFFPELSVSMRKA